MIWIVESKEEVVVVMGVEYKVDEVAIVMKMEES